MSNLLEKASILLTPTAYDDGKILSVKPVPSLGNELITNGDFATDSDWTKGTGWTISGGTANFTPSGSFINLTQSGILTSGKNYTVVYTLSNVTAGNVRARLGTQDGANSSSDGTYTSIITANGTDFSIRTNGTFNGSVDNVSVKEVTRDNVPRIDYTGGGCPHILAEPQRTNLLPYSSDFSQWSEVSGASVSSNSVVSPSGATDADTFTFDGTTYGRLEKTTAVTNGNTYSFSVYLKNNNLSDVTKVWLGFSQTGQGEFVTITNEWQRYETVQVANGSNEYPRVQFTGTGSLYAWGAQLELGSYATSYIPTSGSTVTRNQDIFTRDGIGSLINSTEGVLFAEIAALATINNAADAISIGDGTTANQVAMWYSNSTNQFKVLIRQSGNKLFSTLTLTDAKAFIKVAISYKSGDMKVYINGVSVATSVSPFAFTAPLTLLDLGATGLGNFNGKVKQLQVYDTALTDDQLRQITQ